MSNLLRIGQSHLTTQAIPIEHIGYTHSRATIKRKAHGRTDKRALIGPEIIERQDRQQRQEVLRQQRLQRIQDSPESEVRGATTPPRTTTPPPQHTPPSAQLPIRTPTTAERPRPRRSPSPEASPAANIPPASTAPAQLGRGKRQRQKTSKYAEGQRQGEIQESQERLRRAAAAEMEDDDLYGP